MVCMLLYHLTEVTGIVTLYFMIAEIFSEFRRIFQELTPTKISLEM